MKRHLLFIFGLILSSAAWAQTSNTSATVSYVIGLGANMTCTTVTSGHGSSTTKTEKDGFYDMEYFYGNNTIGAPTNTMANNPCYPSFASWAVQPNSGQTTQIYNASVAYNPKDQKEYYITYLDTTIGGVSTMNSYMFSWPAGTCPGGPLLPVAEFKNSYLLPVFDGNGNAWAVNFVANGSGGYNLFLQEITISGSTLTLGPNDPIVTTAPTVTSVNGDVIFTPQGNMYLVANNEEIAIATSAYSSTSTVNITGTYVGNVNVPGGQYVVGLAYAGGTLVGSVSTGSPSCTPTYVSINLVNGSTTNITFNGASSTNGSGFNSMDNTDLVSGVGAAKSLVSVTQTGNPGEVNVVYDVLVKNYGNYPVSYVQAYDNIGGINGPLNVKNVSLSWVTQPPANYNINLNPSFNGTTNDSLLVSGGTLFNYPVANAYFVIQVSATLENIQFGKIYYNSATAYGVGFNGDRLIDVSTNGNNPDLNNNGKPDDPGEDIPTPFLLQITPTSAPCLAMPGGVLFSETFGAGSSSLTTAFSAGGTSQYTGTTTAPVGVNDYTITNNSKNGNTASSKNWDTITDHTSGTGGMMLVNADLGQNVVYQTKISNLCSGIKYSLNAYVASISDTAAVTFCNAVGGYQPPNLTFQIYDSVDQLTIANLSTGPIWSRTWQSYGMRVPLPSQVTTGTVYLQIINNGGGGCGNDFALDDITFGRCDPYPTVVVDGTHAGCKDSSTVLAVSMSDTSVFSGDTVVYVWQDSIPGSGVWTNVLPPNVTQNQTTGLLTINPVSAANANQYYRVNVANSGNSFSSCSYYSPAFLISLKASSTAPIAVTANPGTTEGCTPTPITLTEQGGFLGDGASYVWYTNGCGTGASIGTGPSITVSPSLTTAYFVRAEGACNVTTCAGVTINNICALPTDLIYFRGTYASGVADLSWEVTDNENLNGFYVERSLDGVTFTRVDSVGAVQDNGTATYSWNDDVASLHTETITYRIVLLFKSGDKKTSSVVAINKPIVLSDGLVVYPNPASHQLTISYNSDREQTLSYVMVNMQGQVLLTGSQVLGRGPNSVNVNEVSTLPNGAYILRIVLQNSVVQKKIIIQK